MKRLTTSLSILVLLTTQLLATPPVIETPVEVFPVGDYIRFTPKTDAVSITYVGLSGVDAFPSEELKDSRRFLLPVRGLAPGKYKFAAIAASKDGEQTRADFTAVIGKTEPGPGPGPGPGPSGGLLFVVVRPDGAVTPEFENNLALPAWRELQKLGHNYTQLTQSAARTLGYTVENLKLPVVITVQKNGENYKVVREAIPLPVTSGGIEKLPEGI